MAARDNRRARPGLRAPATAQLQCGLHGGVGHHLPARHHALVHSSVDELVAAVVPFISEGVDAGDLVRVSLGPAPTAAVAARLGGAAAEVRWTDATTWCRHPAWLLRAVEDLVGGDGRRSGRVRLVGECALPDGPEELISEWERCDAVVNGVLAGQPVSLVCTFDSAAVPASLVQRVAMTHPLVGLDPARASDTYVGPTPFVEAHGARGLVVPERAELAGTGVSPAAARAFVHGRLALAGFDAGRVDDMAIAVSEVVTNSWQAGSTAVWLACWSTERAVVLQVDDNGPGFAEPLAGYRRPPVDACSGRGLWIARQLADVVEVDSGAGGTSVRLHVLGERRPGAPAADPLALSGREC